MQENIRKFYYKFREYIVLILFLLISLALIPLNNHSQIKKIKSYAFGSFALLSYTVDEFGSLFKNDTEIRRLQNLNAKLMLENNLLREYALENDELKSLLAFKDTVDFPLISASIISKLISKSQGNFIINIGAEDSIAVGMPVITEKGFVGIVHEISSHFAIVRTLKNTNLKIGVKNQRSRYEGVLSWDGKDLYLKNIPTTADFEIGDRMVTSEFSSIVPPLIPVGIIERKEKAISGLLNRIYIKPFNDMMSIKNVFVLRLIESKTIDETEFNLLRR